MLHSFIPPVRIVYIHPITRVVATKLRPLYPSYKVLNVIEHLGKGKMPLEKIPKSENSRRLWPSEIRCWKSFPANFDRRYWKIIPRFSGSAKCYPCQGLGIFRQAKWLLENRLRLRERCWIFSSETATAFLSSPD